MNAAAPASHKQDWLLVAAALLASLILLWFITRETLVVGAFGGGLVVLVALAYVVTRRRPAATETEYALPDWSVTVAAIDRPDMAVAITDRAGRLVCANPRFGDWFGTHHAPPRLPVDEASAERLARAARAAWRDGKSKEELAESPEGAFARSCPPIRWRIWSASWTASWAGRCRKRGSLRPSSIRTALSGRPALAWPGGRSAMTWPI